MKAQKMYKIYPIKTYASASQQFINNYSVEQNVTETVNMLTNTDNGYHVRIHPTSSYIMFGDIDNYDKTIEDFEQILVKFLQENYNIKITHDDIFYTQNNSTIGSFHYAVPSLYCSCTKLKEIHTNLKKIVKQIDTSVYSEHWFRMPNQTIIKKDKITKKNKKTVHKIMSGTMKDHFVEYIRKGCIYIEKYEYIDHESIVIENPHIPDNNIVTLNEIPLNNDDILSETYIVNKLLSILDKKRCDEYNLWIKIGFILKHLETNNPQVNYLDIWKEWSKQSEKYSEKCCEQFWKQTKPSDKSLTMGTLHYYAKTDNIEEYKKIMKSKKNKENEEKKKENERKKRENKEKKENKTNERVIFSETEFAKKIYELANDRFVYTINESTGDTKLYCYNGNYWVVGSLLLEKYIVTELFEYYDKLYNDNYLLHTHSKELRRKIDSLHTKIMITHIVHQYKYFGIKDIKFDEKWWLLGFKNKVLDLFTHTFRDYQFDDYISITTGYDWSEPIQKQIDTLETIIAKIMPIKDERELYKQILSTGLQGMPLEKFVLFTGFGRNGKGLTDEFMLHALGDYGIQGNNSILFESSKTGSNPELANLDKKRFVVFKEPSSKRKFENSIIKELTGGGKISARSHYETQTEKSLYNTTVCECNTKPSLAEEPQVADIARIIDLPFRSTFVSEESEVDEKNNIYLIDLNLKSTQFRDEHKFALIQILINAHINYVSNNCVLQIPESVKIRTNEYLEKSCNILGWFKENYSVTDNSNNIVTIKHIHDKFKESEYYVTLSKLEMRKYTYSYFIEYFKGNLVTKKCYKLDYDRIVNGIRVRHTHVIMYCLENNDNN